MILLNKGKSNVSRSDEVYSLFLIQFGIQSEVPTHESGLAAETSHSLINQE